MPTMIFLFDASMLEWFINPVKLIHVKRPCDLTCPVVIANITLLQTRLHTRASSREKKQEKKLNLKGH